MQFKHPEILWALFALLIPILIHLLQLRRFKKTPFTNVAMLQRVINESRKSQNLKKWLLLFSRLSLLAALIIAFAQPFMANSDALTKREAVIYLDNSFSMQANKDGMSLLGRQVQNLVQTIPETRLFSLFTNEHTFKNVTIKEVQNQLLGMKTGPKQLTLDQIALKAESLFSEDKNVIKDLIIISDFQDRMGTLKNLNTSFSSHLIIGRPQQADNVSIDSIYLGQADGSQIPLNIQIRGLDKDNTMPISLYNEDKLIAKTAVKGSDSELANTTLSLEYGESVKGKIVIDDPVLRYDNNFYFNIDRRKKPKILAISENDALFLGRVFSDKYFDFSSFSLANLNYGLIESQNTVILNGLKSIPNSLSTVLKEYREDGGSLIIIPPVDGIQIETYNSFLGSLTAMKFGGLNIQEKKITDISFRHPLYRNVFEKRVTNFDYPAAKASYTLSGAYSTALSFEDGTPFLVSTQNSFIFTTSLEGENSNFINSPLVVPTFYNIGEQSLQNPPLYQTLGKPSNVDIEYRLGQDDILKLINEEQEIIPLQQSFSNKVRLTFEENPSTDGIFSVVESTDTLLNMSFNYSRDESRLRYTDSNTFAQAKTYSNIPELFDQLDEDTAITDYWKWFVIFALLFALLELLIQKLLP